MKNDSTSLSTEVLSVQFPLEYNYEIGAMSVVHYRRLHGMVWTYHRCYGIDVSTKAENGKYVCEINDSDHEKSRVFLENIPMWFLWGNPEFDLVKELCN